jgi:hypothetical protein
MKIIDDVVFVGGTLWTDMNRRDPLTMHAIEGMMNDFRIIRNDQRNYAAMSAQDVVIRHDKTLGYIKHIVQEHKDKRCVVVGHHSPSFQSMHEMYSNDTLMNGGYQKRLGSDEYGHGYSVLVMLVALLPLLGAGVALMLVFFKGAAELQGVAH